jgi:transcriptional regulator with XRE-family HTH domain
VVLLWNIPVFYCIYFRWKYGEGVGGVNFQFLRARLMSHVRARVRNGEISERRLARLAGISQPHIHNVLKGARQLSTEMADRIMQRLRIDLLDLLTVGEGCATHEVSPNRELADSGECRMIAMLDGRIGREYPFPHAVGPEWYPFLAADVQHLGSPIAARLAPDPLRAPLLDCSGVVLLDRAEAVRVDPDEDGYFALDLSGAGTIGLVRRAKRRLYLRVWHADVWQAIPLPDRDPLDVIQGRVIIAARHL